MIEPSLDRVAQWRADTPATNHLAHLNNAGAGLMPAPVVKAMTSHLRLEAERGGYESADLMTDQVAAAYRDVAALIGAEPRNVAMVENATVGVSQALSTFDFRPGDVVITSLADYVSNQIMLLSLKARHGITIRRADDRPEGGVDPDSVARLIETTRAKLVVLSWIPTNSGLIQDVAAVGAVCQRLGVPYLIDGCQAIGQLPVDVGTLGCDFFAATARKFLRGPRGQGFLFVSDRILESGRFPLYVDLRGATWTEADGFALAPDARRYENWEFSYAGILGLGEAARYARSAEAAGGLVRAGWLAEQLRDRLAKIPGVRVMDRGAARGVIVTADLGRDAFTIMQTLRTRQINTSTLTRSSAVIDMDAKGISSALRISPHYYNTTAELDRVATELAELLAAR